ncbi:MAG: NAD(P)H-dependent oxidoreductase [Lactobacillaceae bacterium]|nr:NAD(P)H-dependent oxidoreductase [Lactobacillaceae bacterium]
MMTKIGFVVGSLRKDSSNLKIAKNMMKDAPTSIETALVDISDLPIYNEDLDEGDNVPASWERLRNEVAGFDGFVFVSPEYNRSIPAVLKNALDVASRPYGHNMWDGKPALIITSTPGAMGGSLANHTIRQSLVFLNMPVVQQPEMYIGNTATLFDDNGIINNRGTSDYLQSGLTALVEKINAND